MTTPMSCVQVLEVLSDYLDGDLDDATRESVDAHLSGCDRCTRFGGEVGAVVRALRTQLGVSADVSPAVADELDRVLK